MDKKTLKHIECWLREPGINISDVLQRIQDEVKRIDTSEFVRIKSGRPASEKGDLIWTYCGKTEVIHKNKSFNFLQSERVRLQKLPQFNGGKFEIKYTK